MRSILTIVMALIFGFVHGQSCELAADNPLCAQSAATSASMIAQPFSYGCFDVQMSYFFLLETGTQGGQTQITITRDDCDYIFVNPVTGTAQVALDTIYMTIIQLNPNGTPCDTNSYLGQFGCYNFHDQDQTFNINNLPAASTFIVVVGSNHQGIFGPCSINVSASGPPLEISSDSSPLFIFAGQQASLTVGGAPAGASYSWSPAEFVSNPTGQNPSAFPTETTAFAVQSNIGTCLVSDTVIVPVGVPINYGNAISPNGDNVNDSWEIEGIEKFDRAEINIYDRWGQNVFRSIGYATAWDGTNRGKKLPTGSYYYVIELNSPVVYIEPFTGYISVLH
jgi:gliding motility-associated-like protein